jgi:SAM-dependent methyltransferase
VLTDGEQWTREQLRRLRDDGFRTAALWRFLLASQDRASAVRRLRPELARRERAVAAAGAGTWLALAGLGVEPFRGRVRIGLGAWTSTVLMLDWHLGMLETPDGRPRNLSAADAATLTRAWLVPAVADRPSAALCAIGFATDVLDGRLARATEPTRLGRDFEPLVDAAFAAAALRGARRRRWLSRAAIAAESVRVTAGLAYGVGVYFGRAKAPDPRVVQAARVFGPLRAAALILAGAGKRRTGDRLLLTASLLSIAAFAHALRPRAASFAGVPQAAWGRLSGQYDRQLWLERSAVRAALDLADCRPGDRFLDAGTGTGAVLRELAERSTQPDRAVGVDASGAMLGRVPPLPTGWTVHRSEIQALPFGAGAFDVAVASYLLHVLPTAELPAVLAELARVLRPGGRLVTVTPALPASGLLRPLALALDAIAPHAPSRFGGLRAFDPRPALERAGFEIVGGRSTRRGYPSLCVLARKPGLSGLPDA